MSSRCCHRTWSATCGSTSTGTGGTRRDPTSPHDPAERHAEIARFSAADADAYPSYERHLAGLGRVLGPLLHQIPPRLGSRRPQDLLRQARLLTSLRGIDERGAVDVTRLLTGSIADLLEGYFESDAMLGLLSVSGGIGTWAGAPP